MTTSFIGTSLRVGDRAVRVEHAGAGWGGVCITGMIMGALAFGVYAGTYKKRIGVK